MVAGPLLYKRCGSAEGKERTGERLSQGNTDGARIIPKVEGYAE